MKGIVAPATRALVKKGSKFLILTKSSKEDVTPNTYDLPGGRFEFGENPEEAIVREVKEETGLDVKVVKLINATAPIVKEKLQLFVATFLCKHISGELKLSSEHESAKWMSAQQILNSGLPDWIKQNVLNSRQG